MHGHGDEARVIITFQKRFLHPVRGHAPVGKRQVGIGLQLIAEAPEDDAGVVAVAFHPLRDVVLPQFRPRPSATAVLREPLVIEFIHDKDAQRVAEIQQALAVGVMAGADVVEAIIFEQSQPFLDGARIGGGTQCTQCVVVGNALQQHLAAVELHAEGG